MTFIRPGLPPAVERQSHVFIAALGFEKRATFAACKYAEWSKRKVALAFPHQEIFNYGKNQKYFKQAEFVSLLYSDSSWREHCADMLEQAEGNQIEGAAKHSDFCIDVSSMSRPMIAEVLLLFRSLAVRKGRPITAKLLYSPAEYVPPPTVEGPIVKSEPVVPEFAGWSMASGAPSVAIVGLGYEPDFALGTWEYLEASSLVAFFPTGEDVRYDEAVRKANEEILKQIGDAQVCKYRVDDPVHLFIILNTLVSGYLGIARPIIVPFGPKIFAVTALLVALIHQPAVTVWRVSGDQDALPVDREANGKVVVLDLQISP